MVTCRPSQGYTSPREAPTLISHWWDDEGGQWHKMGAFLAPKYIVPDASFGSPVKELVKKLANFFHNQMFAKTNGCEPKFGNPEEVYDLFLKYIDISICETNSIPSCEMEPTQLPRHTMDMMDDTPGDHATGGQLWRSKWGNTPKLVIPKKPGRSSCHSQMRGTGLKAAQNQPQTYP